MTQNTTDPKHTVDALVTTAALSIYAELLREALDGVMIGGNHLATILVHKVGDNFAFHYPPDMDPQEALRTLCATTEYDVWCCWAAIMRARATLTQGEGK